MTITTAFQYQKGAIKTAVVLAGDPALLFSFNTKKVRLKLPVNGLLGRQVLTFQYQKGAIKTKQAEVHYETRCDDRFQYQKGAIKTAS